MSDVRVVEALLGATPDWSAERCVLVGTGRAPGSADELAALGAAAERLPVFC